MLLRCPRFAVALFLSIAPLLPARTISAQAVLTASKTMDLSAFGGYTRTNPDFGNSTDSNGYSLGVNITRYFRFPVAPSLEARANIADAYYVNEHTFVFGLRAQGEFLRRYHPYADLLVGPGTIHFNFPTVAGYYGDNSIVESVGGGVDIDVTQHFAAKVDYQKQYWTLGVQHGTDESFSPSLLLVGVSYRIPMHPWVTQDRLGR